MSDYRVVGAVDQTLTSLLWSHMQFDSEITSILSSEQRLVLDAPSTLIKEADPVTDALSVYLYRVVEDAEMKNRPFERLNGQRLRYPPLALDLFYLITPVTNHVDNDHKILGKAMQIFYDNGVIKGSLLKGILENTTSEIRVTLNALTMEDLSKLWSAFMRPLRLCVSYQVKAVYIDSERELSSEQVRRKRLEFTQLGGA